MLPWPSLLPRPPQCLELASGVLLLSGTKNKLTPLRISKKEARTSHLLQPRSTRVVARAKSIESFAQITAQASTTQLTSGLMPFLTMLSSWRRASNTSSLKKVLQPKMQEKVMLKLALEKLQFRLEPRMTRTSGKLESLTTPQSSMI